jgi:predicted transcriptional regulator
MEKVRKKSKQLDQYLRSVIQKVPEQIEDFISSNESKMTYYTGSWSTDVLNNFTEKQSEKIFNKMKTLQDKVVFVQRKLPFTTEIEDDNGNIQVIQGYEYQVMRA